MFNTNTEQFKEEATTGEENPNKKILLIIIPLTVIILLLVGFFIYKYLNKKPVSVPVAVITDTSSTTPVFLPTETSTSTENIASSTIPDAIEKITFADFYKEPAPLPEFKIDNYTLPLNVKIDTLNYYSVSRKFDLDKGVEDLNNNGFTILDNPDIKEVTNFYGAYSYLAKKDVPLLITSDFLLHYHQNIVKQVFKDIEENVFYDNLYKITKSLYESSKIRYEARLSKIGNINDSVLEGERLAMAYFAVTLKLLEPTTNQIDTTGKDVNKFTALEAQGLYFNVLPYLQSDVLEEISLIRGVKEKKKSPVLLYNRDYTEFIVPQEYRGNEKLYNFYLASTWLNSTFPLVIKDKSCPDCLLDKDASYLSLIASSFITKDFASDQNLKNRWALIYKLISYQKGLRDDLTYLDYDQQMKSLFGDNYDPEIIFAERNPDKTKNLDKFRDNLLAISFNDFQGALSKKDDKPRLGFKLLSDYYWPNDYIFNRLVLTNVGLYNGTKTDISNITVCKGVLNRCNGFGLDIIGLIHDKIIGYTYWEDNVNYVGYDQKIGAIKDEFNKTLVWHTNNFWSLLGTLKIIFESNSLQTQAYSSTDAWQKRLVNSAVSAWIDLQLPLEPLLPAGDDNAAGGLSNLSSTGDDYYIEPDYALIQKLVAENEMIDGMMGALNINKQVSSVSLALKEEHEKLIKTAAIIKKELNSEALSSDDQAFIGSFTKQYKLAGNYTSQFNLKFTKDSLSEKVDIKFMALAYKLGEGKFIAIGPIFSFKETR